VRLADRRLQGVVVHLVVLVGLLWSSFSTGVAQENDYRIVPGQRIGRFNLGRPLDAYGLGQPSWQGTGTTASGLPVWDNYFFVTQALRVDVCRSNGLSFAIFVYRRLDRPETEVEAARYKTAEGIGVGADASEVFRLLGPAEGSSEWTERQGRIDIPLTEYRYAGGGLLIRVSRGDRKVIAVGVQTQGGRPACEGDVVVAQAVRDAVQRPIPAVRRPVALTSCEIDQLRRRLINETEARRLYGASFRLAEEALDDPPSPLPRIQREGLLPTDPRAQLSARFYRDVSRIEALGYAYAATGDARFAQRAAVYLEAWANVNQPDGNPINETQISRAVRGLSLVADAVPASTRTQVERWLSRMASLQIERRPQWEINEPNNWYSHRLKVVGLIGYVLGDSRFVRYAEDGYRTQIAQNLRADGSSLDFHQRDALHYHVYNLEPLVELAMAADKQGTDLYSYQAPTGASLERSLAFLLPYVRGEKVHIEFARTTVPFDRQRAAAGVLGFSGPWDPLGAARLLEMAGYFNPAFANEPIRGHVRSTFQTVLNVVRAACRGK
jgi:hypothetical protein